MSHGEKEKTEDY